jgi:large conductance mechanosensitive channel
MLKEFREFILRGNLVDLAVAVVIGTAFAAVVFFFVVKPVNALMDRMKTEPPIDERTRACPECRSDIPMLANRCAFCTAQVGPDPSVGPGPATAPA